MLWSLSFSSPLSFSIFLCFCGVVHHSACNLHHVLLHFPAVYSFWVLVCVWWCVLIEFLYFCTDPSWNTRKSEAANWSTTAEIAGPVVACLPHHPVTYISCIVFRCPGCLQSSVLGRYVCVVFGLVHPTCTLKQDGNLLDKALVLSEWLTFEWMTCAENYTFGRSSLCRQVWGAMCTVCVALSRASPNLLSMVISVAGYDIGVR